MPLVRSLAALALAALASVASFAACKSTCPGTTVNGQCETECTDAACAAVKAGARCYQNACVLPCAVTADCLSGQSCKKAQTDSGAIGRFCFGEAPAIGGTDGEPCKVSSDCAATLGYACVAGACTFTCLTHDDCESRGSCTGTAKDAGGKAVRLCEADSFPRGPGEFGTRCPNRNECAGCPKDGCTGAGEWGCIGAGVGDVDAYCTHRFCADDAGCPTGFFCATRTTSIPPCEDACDATGDKTVDCIPAPDSGPGKHYTCGKGFLVLSVCLKRDFCNTCDSDVDCLGKPNRICAKDESGEKICTVRCDAGLNSCPWGSATTCGVWDDGLGVATCEHRFGSCHGTGKSCEPCIDNTDCPNGYCTQTKFSGEHFCVDQTLPVCSCPDGTKSTCAGGGCPASPSGLQMTCYAGSAFVGQVGFGTCIGATADSTTSASQESCWPAQ